MFMWTNSTSSGEQPDLELAAEAADLYAMAADSARAGMIREAASRLCEGPASLDRLAAHVLREAPGDVTSCREPWQAQYD